MTENVVVLFTDVVGSTALAWGLAPDAADELRRGHFAVLRQAVAEAGGAEVKSLGDGLMVVFGAASAALSCAVAMQQGVDRDNRRREYSVGLRVGLSGGEVTREDADYFGDPVIEAARLCAHCDGGQVLAAEIVRLMAGRRSRHECRSVGKLALKGLAEPVDTVEVRWEPVAGADGGPVVPLPGRLEVRPAVGVVGRDVEGAVILDAFKRVEGGEGREVVLISGEAGLGKSTLVAEAARVAFDSGACVLFGHTEDGLASPYQLFTEALGHFVTHAPAEQLLVHAKVHGSELARLLPALSSRLPDLGPSTATEAETERYQLFAAVVGLLEMVSYSQPVVVVLDDLQWADTASLQLLRHVIATDRPMRLLVVGVYRDSELSRAHPLLDTLAELHRHPGVARIELRGLDNTGVVSLMEAAAGHSLDAAAAGLARALWQETDGNPFFVSEVLRHLAETGVVHQDGTGRWVTESIFERVALPSSVRAVIGARVGRLGSNADRVLSLASVIGRDFDVEVLARASDTSEDELLDILDAAVAASLVRELTDTPGHYNFAHALIQHTLYEGLGLTRRARAHRRVAEALEDMCGDRPGPRVGDLARHWSNTTDVAKALAFTRRAADAALGSLAPADALRYYTQALDLHAQDDNPDPILGIDLAVGLGTAQRQTGDPTFRETLLHAARCAADVGDTERLVAAVLANNRGTASSNGTIDTDKVELLEITLDRLSARDPDRALVLATLCAELCYGSSLERRQALAEEAVALAESVGDDATIVRVLNPISFSLLVPPLLEQSLAWTADALLRAERVGDPYLLFWAAQSRAITATCAGDIDEMHRCYDTVGSLAALLDQPLMNWMHTFNCALRAQLAGDIDYAEQLATEALAIGSAGGQPDVKLFYAGQVVATRYDRGTLGEMVPLIEQIVADVPGVAATFAPALALAHVEAGQLDDARRVLEAFAATGFDHPMDALWMFGMAQYSDAAIACRDQRYAAPLFDQLAAYPDRVANTGVSVGASVSYHLGGLAAVLGRYDQAHAYFTRAAAFNDHAHAKAHAARTHLGWATMLTARNAPGDNEQARDLLTKAQTAAATHGYANIHQRATEALQHLD